MSSAKSMNKNKGRGCPEWSEVPTASTASARTSTGQHSPLGDESKEVKDYVDSQLNSLQQGGCRILCRVGRPRSSKLTQYPLPGHRNGSPKGVVVIHAFKCIAIVTHTLVQISVHLHSEYSFTFYPVFPGTVFAIV